jgi:hypothetical protein
MTRPSGRDLSRAARLGLTLRSVMLTPRAGYASAFRAAERRARTGESRPEGWTPYVLSALGGAGAMCWWLKVGPLLGVRGSKPTFDLGLLVGALGIGAVLALAGQLLWGAIGPRIVSTLGHRARGTDLRLAWGAAAFPLAFVLVLLPVDIAVAGSGAFMPAPLGDAVVTAWVALSLAITTSLVLWAAWLFLRGLEAAAELHPGRALVVAFAAAACLAVAAGAFVVAGTIALGGPTS